MPTHQGGDAVNHPPHYNWHPTIECLEVVREFNYNKGNAIKYVWRAGHKGGPQGEIEDIDKAIQYLEDERKRIVDRNTPVDPQ